jgi:membrane protein YqaA with SNARE-associated domain
MDVFFTWGFVGLFLVCFLSATILPLPSEALVIYFLTQHYDAHWVLVIASVGNSLGGSTTYFLGRWGNKIRTPKTNKISVFLQKFGAYGAFFSWVPFIGDPVLLALGYWKSPTIPTLFWMTCGKTLRYLVLCWAFIQ